MSVTGTPASLNSFKYIVNDPSVKTIITGRALNSDTTNPPKLHQDRTSWACICVYLGLRTHKLRVWATMRVTGVFLLLARIAQVPILRGIITRRRRTTIISIGNHSILVASSSCLARSSVRALYVTWHTVEIHRIIHTNPGVIFEPCLDHGMY